MVLLIIRIINGIIIAMERGAGIPRTLDLPALLRRKSILLLGPRGTGKSWLIRERLGDSALRVDLLRSDRYLRLSADPGELEAMIDASGRELVVIDEVQKIPALLDEAHRLIEERGLRFLLTGSSARKLKRSQANLLAGRAWIANLFPLTWNELGARFNLERYLRYGGLPAVYGSEDPAEELRAYVDTYLKEEIQAEGLVRRLPAFHRFLKVAALDNGRMLNYAHVAADAGVPAASVREHYSILADTLTGFMLEPWRESKKRKAIQTPKFYFFDTGVAHALAQTETLDRNSDLYGRSFEQWLGLELRARLSYARSPAPLTYWRSVHAHEVDFVIGERAAVEVKASRRATDRDAAGLSVLAEERVIKSFYLVSQDPVHRRRKVGAAEVEFIPYQLFLRRLWNGELPGVP